MTSLIEEVEQGAAVRSADAGCLTRKCGNCACLRNAFLEIFFKRKHLSESLFMLALGWSMVSSQVVSGASLSPLPLRYVEGEHWVSHSPTLLLPAG